MEYGPLSWRLMATRYLSLHLFVLFDSFVTDFCLGLMNLRRHFLILKVCFYYNLTQPPQVWLLVRFHITMFNLFCLIENKIVVFSWPKVILMRVTWGNTNKMFAKCSFLLMAILLISNRKKRKKIVLELLKIHT